MLFIVFFESFALQCLLLAKYQPQHKYNEVRSSYSNILLRITDFRITGKKIGGSSRNVNKQGQRKPGRFPYSLHFQSFFSCLEIPDIKPKSSQCSSYQGYAQCTIGTEPEAFGSNADVRATHGCHEQCRKIGYVITMPFLLAHQINGNCPQGKNRQKSGWPRQNSAKSYQSHPCRASYRATARWTPETSVCKYTNDDVWISAPFPKIRHDETCRAESRITTGNRSSNDTQNSQHSTYDAQPVFCNGIYNNGGIRLFHTILMEKQVAAAAQIKATMPSVIMAP